MAAKAVKRKVAAKKAPAKKAAKKKVVKKKAPAKKAPAKKVVKKKTPAKKAPAKKVVKKKTAPKKVTTNKGSIDRQKEFLVKELRGLIPKLDSEGLAFLVEQGRIHLYNMQVVKLNRAAVAAHAASSRAGQLAKKTGKTAAAAAKGGKDKFVLRGSETGSSYYLYFRNDDIMFSKTEIVQLVNIASGPGSSLEIKERIYNWFRRERTDFFGIVPIADKFDDRLKELAALFKKSFKVRHTG